MLLIGITGTDGGGKGTAVEELVAKHGFTHYSSRQFILEHINAAGLPTTRNQMRLTANELRRRHGNDFLVKRALELIERNGIKKAIVESIRAVAEAEALKAAGGYLLAVDADQALRYERVQARRSESDKVSLAEFIRHEELEKNDPDPNGMQKAKVIAMADHLILNNKTPEDFKREVSDYVRGLG